jgi:site-specific DNA-methyltransferase (adenine-specific)
MLDPYYDEGGITIYNDLCENVLPHVDREDVGLVLTDPPYGIDYKGSHSKWSGRRVHGDDVRFDPEHLLLFGRCVIWGANYFAHDLPETAGWLIWDKRLEDSTDSGLKVPDGEMAWTNVSKRTRIYRELWAGPLRGTEGFVHPTQKPVNMMKWILRQWTEKGDLVLDPYMGSGPVAEACRDLGRRYIGVEVEERYCEVAVSRLSVQAFPFYEED